MNNELKENKNLGKKKKSKLMFYISFIPFMILLLIGIKAAIKGSKGICPFGGCPTRYGLVALFEEILIYTCIFSPVLLLPLIYIIYYIRENIKTKHKRKNKNQIR